MYAFPKQIWHLLFLIPKAVVAYPRKYIAVYICSLEKKSSKFTRLTTLKVRSVLTQLFF